MMQGKVNIGIDENNPFVGCQDITQLCDVRLQEFPSCRYVEEQILHFEVTAHRTRYRLLREHLRSCNHQLRTYLIFLTAGLQLHLRHGCNRGQRLATEAHRVEGKEISGLLDFRGGMTLERETGICLRHAFSIVDHLN